MPKAFRAEAVPFLLGTASRAHTGTALSLLLLLTASAAIGQTKTVSIQGTVVDAKTQKPVPAALVVASRLGTPPSAKSTKSGGDGAFQIQGLVDGKYSLCVQAGDQYLDPCQWNGGPTGVVLTSGQAVAGIKIALTPASVLNVQVQDAQKVLGQKTKDGRRPELTLGVWGSRGLYYPARLAGNPPAAGGLQGGITTYSYQLAVPRNTALKLYIASRDLKLGDSTGVALPANASQQTFQHATGDANPKSFTFFVLGLLP
ncbi:MAG TPA: carboxypeptidase-like regulatory domain-containing protein [Bryobacteraceae bacterium]|nr:carboxypeptidase-like regulatory domain-containing protein [Bryobacteraceae bacterium]